ncbi:hypothetical protein C8R41DRAFT_864018 [Lentinula lateritia]|uniref:RING-type domain-containing protein n=1 Tax=Lentinula lateritia TaxID=40482 RepID=A0ABQ8VS72_9AGAR|nr:hypothetical protein C8R41DRAFT_864018 [Lentinula lateritia]
MPSTRSSERERTSIARAEVTSQFDLSPTRLIPVCRRKYGHRAHRCAAAATSPLPLDSISSSLEDISSPATMEHASPRDATLSLPDVEDFADQDSRKQSQRSYAVLKKELWANCRVACVLILPFNLGCRTHCGHVFCAGCMKKQRRESLLNKEDTNCGSCGVKLVSEPVPCNALQDSVNTFARMEDITVPKEVKSVWIRRTGGFSKSHLIN